MLLLLYYWQHLFISQTSFLQIIGEFSIFAIIGGAFAFINSYLWNIKPFCWLYSVPDFSGRYEGTLSYKYRDNNCTEVSSSMTHQGKIILLYLRL